MTFCIVCATELHGRLCPGCGWRLEDDAAGAPAASVGHGVIASTAPARAAPAPTPARAAPTPGAIARSRNGSVHCTTKPMLGTPAPLVDFAMREDGFTYVLSEAMGGKAASLARWGNDGFDTSAMLAIAAPIGLETLDDRSPIVIGGTGITVNVTFPGRTGGGSMPVTRGHRTRWSVACFAISPGRDLLALGDALERSVHGLRTADFAESVLVTGLPGNPTAVAWSGDGRVIAVGCYGGELCVQGVSGGRRTVLERPSGNEGVVALAAAPRGGWVAAYEDRHVVAWNASGLPVCEDVVEADITALAVDARTGQVVAGTTRGDVCAWTPMLEERVVAKRVHKDRVTRILAFLDKGIAVSAARSGEIVAMELGR